MKAQRKPVQRFLFTLIAVFIFVLSFSSVQSAKAANYKKGDIISFGSYPQSRVTNSSTVKALNKNLKKWQSFDLYNTNSKGKTKKSDYFKYADVTYNGVKYRAIKFSSYRTVYYDFMPDYPVTMQQTNGYKKNTVYWFKYEPIKWVVLDASKGLVVSQKVLDSNEFNNPKDKKYNNSLIRSWLNSNFYNWAFTSSDRNKIVKTKLSKNQKGSFSTYTKVTTDNVFLLSETEVKKGFADDFARRAESSDYAKAMGNSTSFGYYGELTDEFSCWWIRSDDPCGVSEDGYIAYYYSNDSTTGVRPAICIKLNSLNSSSATYNIAFNKNSSSAKGSMSTSKFYVDSSQNLPENSFTRKGYHFTGWATEPNGKVKYKNKASVKNLTSKNLTVTLYAVWEPNTYQVQFVANCNNSTGTMKKQSFTYTKSKKLTSNKFKRKGYTFAGWATSKNGKVVYKNSQSVKNLTAENNKTVKLYAKWTANTYKIKFDKNDNSATGLLMGDIVCSYGKKYNLPANTYKKTNYHLKGWATSKNGKAVYNDGEEIKNITSTDNKTVTLYAVWEKNYSNVVFYPNTTDVSGKMTSVKVDFDEKIKLPQNDFSKAGYHFVGWATDPKGKVVYKNKAEFSKKPEKSGEEFSLYGKWERNTFTVVLNGNGTDNWKPSNISCTYGKKKNLPENKFKLSGYKFLGWSKTPDGEKVFDDTADISGETIEHKGKLELYAIWGSEVVYLSNTDNEEMRIDYALRGKSYKLYSRSEPKFNKDNHYILSWNTQPDGSGINYKPDTASSDISGKNIILYAIWKEYDQIIAPVDLSTSNWYALTYENHAPKGEPFQEYATDWNSAKDVGAPVRAIADGTVELSITNNGSIRIRHSVELPLRSGYVIEPYTWFSWYGHMKNIVPKGTNVKKGDIIGYISNVATTNDHLHFAIYAANSAWEKPSYGISPYWIPGELSNADIYKDNVYGTREPSWLYYDFLISDKEMPGYNG